MCTHPSSKPLLVKSGLKAGGFQWNHGQRLTVKSGLKAGGFRWNHHQRLA